MGRRANLYPAAPSPARCTGDRKDSPCPLQAAKAADSRVSASHRWVPFGRNGVKPRADGTAQETANWEKLLLLLPHSSTSAGKKAPAVTVFPRCGLPSMWEWGNYKQAMHFRKHISCLPLGFRWFRLLPLIYGEPPTPGRGNHSDSPFLKKAQANST